MLSNLCDPTNWFHSVILFRIFEILLKLCRDIQQGLYFVKVLTIQDGEVFLS